MTGAVRLALGLVALLAGCAEHPEAREPVWLAERGKVYCYRTLAEPDCHARPVSGAEGRLIGVGPPSVLPALVTSGRRSWRSRFVLQ